MVKVISVKCPECGSNSVYDGDNDYCFCQHCGTKILIERGVYTTHVYRKIDESRIKEAEIKETIRLKELELAEKEFETKEKTKKLKIKAMIILGIICAFCLAVGYTMIETGDDILESLSFSLVLIGFLCLGAIVCIVPSDKQKDDTK